MKEQECFDELYQLLQSVVAGENAQKVKDRLRVILSEGSAFEGDVVQPLTYLLGCLDLDVRSLTAETVAELCKCDKKRVTFAQNDVVERLVINLGYALTSVNAELTKQACRALGNVCFESFVGRDLLVGANGINVIIELLPQTLVNPAFDEVRLYACKLLLVVLLGGADYVKVAVNAGVVDRVRSVIEYEFQPEKGDDGRLYEALVVLTVVLEHARHIVMDKRLILMVVEVLKKVKNLELSEVCLEFLHYQADHDNVKILLANAEVPHLLWALLEKYRTLAVDQETRDAMKVACDLIALILTGDVAMQILYANGTGEFYEAMLSSVEADDLELSITAILAVGNFARTDAHCTQMMDRGVFTRLLALLREHREHEEDIRLQHAILSGLRNLVIPQRNKSIAIQEGLLQLLMEMVQNITQYHVVFKLLATLRMLVDGQEVIAKELTAPQNLRNITAWGLQTDHNGVSGEASRLIARIVRQLKCREALFRIVTTNGCVSCMINMLSSAHGVMHNEAIIGLTVLCAIGFVDAPEASDAPDGESADGDNFRELYTELLLGVDIVKQLTLVLQMSATKMRVDLPDNFYKLLSLLITQPVFKRQMNNGEFLQQMNILANQNPYVVGTLKEIYHQLIVDIETENAQLTE